MFHGLNVYPKYANHQLGLTRSARRRGRDPRTTAC